MIGSGQLDSAKGGSSGFNNAKLSKMPPAVAGRSMDQLPRLCQRLGTVDFFFHDSEHTYQNMMWEYRTVWPRIRLGGGVLASHDVDWNRAFADFAQANNLEPTIPVDGFGLVTR